MRTKNFLLLLLTAAAIMVVALFNGFPLTEGDTGAYIQQAIYPHFAADRTPFYGMFIRITSMWTSLWYPVFMQCLILAYLLLRYIHLFPLPGRGAGYSGPFRLTLLIVITIVSFTCVAWVSAYLMPDIFAGIMLLAVILFLLSPAGDLKLKMLDCVIIFGALIVHTSHFLILSLFSVVFLFMALRQRRRPMVARTVVLLCLCASSFVLMSAMNAAKNYGFTYSRGRNIFMVAKLAETGILSVYLDENCDKKNLKLCAYRDQIPTGLSDFLWIENSPLYKMGGWDSCQAEFGVISHDVLTRPRYLKMFVRKAVVNTLKQLTQIQAPDRLPAQGSGTQPWMKVRQYFEDEFREYNQSLQNNNLLSASGCNYIYYLFFILSSGWMLIFSTRVMNRDTAFIYNCIFLFLVINAGIMSTFSTVIYRFQYRVFWILPATNAIVILKYYYTRIKEKDRLAS